VSLETFKSPPVSFEGDDRVPPNLQRAEQVRVCVWLHKTCTEHGLWISLLSVRSQWLRFSWKMLHNFSSWALIDTHTKAQSFESRIDAVQIVCIQTFFGHFFFVCFPVVQNLVIHEWVELFRLVRIHGLLLFQMAAHSESNSTTCNPHLVLCIFLLIILSQTLNRLLCLMRFEFTCHEMFRIYLPQMNLLVIKFRNYLPQTLQVNIISGLTLSNVQEPGNWEIVQQMRENQETNL
jgi:hypothetical protein